MMSLLPTPDSFWECVFPRVEKLWPNSLQDALWPLWSSGREMFQFPARQLALSPVCGYRLLVLLFGQGAGKGYQGCKMLTAVAQGCITLPHCNGTALQPCATISGVHSGV